MASRAALPSRLLSRIAALAALCCFATAQVQRSGPQVLTFLSDIDDTDQPYGLYLPKGYDSSKKYPLVISLHGAGSNHRLNLRRVFGLGNRLGETDAEATRFFPPFRDVDFLVATPLARGTMGYQGLPEKDVYDVLADVRNRFNIDPDRIYLTGLSLGGGGALWLALTRPDLWAAVAAVCPAVPDGSEPIAGNALNLPVKLFQGALDPVIPAAVTRGWNQRFIDLGVKADYVEYRGMRHNAWDAAYKDASIFPWFTQFRRERFPQHVRFAAQSYKHGSAYWVRLDSFTPGALAEFDGKLGDGNRIAVTTKNLDGFTLLLKGHPLVLPARAVSLLVDGTRLTTKMQDAISVSRTPKGWVLRRAVTTSGQKTKGAEGPISEAMASRHLYVYGTVGAADAEEVARRREQATYASEWSTPRLRLALTFRVAADADVPAGDRKISNLVLFGTKETNSVIAQLAGRLPLALNPGAADYGLLYVYPADGRYVVVNSGLPWWTRLDQANRPGLSFISAPYRTLLSFGDYVLFKGGLDNVVAEGRFNRDWKLPPEAAALIRSTGAVEVRQ